MQKNGFELNGIRLLNACKTYGSWVIASTTKKPIYCGAPVAASIEPANFCNLRCPQCPTGMGMSKRHPKLLSIEDFRHIIKQLLPELMYLNLYFQGEPFLNNKLTEMVEIAGLEGIFCSISTNGQIFDAQTAQKLKKANLGKLIVSVDGADEESYLKYRVGGSFDKVINCLKTAVSADLPVELQCLLLESTEKQIQQIKELARKCGVKKVVFKTAQLYSDKLAPTNEKLSRYKRNDKGELVINHKLHNCCRRLWESVVISTDGEVLPCCFDKGCNYSFGNIFKEDIRDIMHGEKARKFRQAVLTNRKGLDICRNCTS